MFETPVLLIIFNRPEITKRTFDSIRKVRPRRLFIAGDGPRAGVSTDVSQCAKARAIIQLIDWPCNLQTYFREENRGCGHGPAEAITWFLQQVNEGIILEDDCLADPSFFPYCEFLLNKYRHDKRVYMISGTNGVIKWKSRNNSYFFNYMAQSLGWATWQRAWENFDYKLDKWEIESGKKILSRILPNKTSVKYYSNEFTTYRLIERNDVWDYQWAFARWLNAGFTIAPSVNLIKNIGFNEDATHSTDENNILSNNNIHRIIFPLKSTSNKTDWLFDWVLFERFVNPASRPLWKKIILKLVKQVYQK